MSRRATNEYIGMKRRAYQAASRPKRREILAEVCTNTGYTKDYDTRLLSGSRKFRERKGRGKKFGSVQRNRRSGVSNSLKNAIECKSGKEIMACCVKPGDMQVDTFALCGGSMEDNFYWILTATDRRTQWTRISSAWNRGEATTLGAPGRIAAHIPFEVRSMHSDNGGVTRIFSGDVGMGICLTRFSVCRPSGMAYANITL